MKGRLLISVLIIATISQGCSVLVTGPIRNYRDDFTGGRRYVLTQSAKPREWASQISGATMIFEKRVSDIEIKNTLYMVVSRSRESFKSEENGYIRIDDKIFGVSLAGSTIEPGWLSAEVAGDDSENESALTGKINEKFRIDLTDEIVSAINGARRVEIRLYFGPEPATYRLQGTKLSRLRRLLNR